MPKDVKKATLATQSEGRPRLSTQKSAASPAISANHVVRGKLCVSKYSVGKLRVSKWYVYVGKLCVCVGKLCLSKWCVSKLCV